MQCNATSPKLPKRPGQLIHLCSRVALSRECVVSFELLLILIQPQKSDFFGGQPLNWTFVLILGARLIIARALNALLRHFSTDVHLDSIPSP